ncbi:MAG: OsmC family protein [Planctomycetota bacterium]|jgi:putative redox protein
MYAERKGWPLEGVEMRLRHQKVKAEGQTVPIDEIDAELRILGDLDEAQRERLLDIAHRCPVHRTLLSEVKIRMQAV